MSHAATALLFKRRYPRVGLWPLLLAVQLVELLWVVFTYTGIEHVSVNGDVVHLDFLPYSHSVFTGVALGVAAWLLLSKGFNQPALGAAVALGIVSHVVLDIIQHEPNITLLPIEWGPRLGLGLTRWPFANFVVELGYGILCWRIYRGPLGLLIGIVVFTVLEAPFMFPQPGAAALIAAHPAVLTTMILIQIVASWLIVRWLAMRNAKSTIDEDGGLRSRG